MVVLSALKPQVQPHARCAPPTRAPPTADSALRPRVHPSHSGATRRSTAPRPQLLDSARRPAHHPSHTPSRPPRALAPPPSGLGPDRASIQPPLGTRIWRRRGTRAGGRGASTRDHGVTAKRDPAITWAGPWRERPHPLKGRPRRHGAAVRARRRAAGSTQSRPQRSASSEESSIRPRGRPSGGCR